MLKYTLPLLLCVSSFAKEYTLSFAGSSLTNRTLGVEKLANNEKTKHKGGMFEISVAEDKAIKFFGINTRNAIHMGYLQGQYCNFDSYFSNEYVCTNKVYTLAFGLDKQLYHNFNRLQVLGFFGLGYKLTGQLQHGHNYDYALPSQFYFRLGMELNYFITKRVSVGLQYKHFSNGGLTIVNYGYDMYGVKVGFAM